MNVETAHLVLYSIASVAVVVWLAGLQFLFASARRPRLVESIDAADSVGKLPIQGTVEVEGEPEHLASRAASILGKGTAGQIGPVRIVSRTADAVVFEGDRASMALGRYVRQGAIHFAPSGQGRTRIEFALDVPQGKTLLCVGAVFQILGLAAIIIAFWSLNTYVVDAANPAVRVQAVQMVQVCHLLWPPFLFGALYRQRHRALVYVLSTFALNLPYCEP